MKWTNSFIPTVKEDPADAESISHKLMMRSGLIRKLAAGTYNYLPLGMRILNKAINIVRQEMDRAGALEVLLPALHPPEPWEQTGRLKDFGDTIFRITDRTGKLNVLGPTHEEIITSLVANEVSSYRQLPVTLYQIQTKFRDELRPRFGIIRSKEFLMMDAYSFHTDQASLDQSYKKMYEAYCRIFDRCKLPYKIIEADPGLMGGSGSHEFICPSPAGEDLFVTCTKCSYCSNPNLATIQPPKSPFNKGEFKALKEVATPGKSTIEALAAFLNAKPSQMVKTMICNTSKGPVAALVRGDYELNLSKLAKLLNSAVMELADEKTIAKVTGGPVGFSGPVGLNPVRSEHGQANNIITGSKTSALDASNWARGIPIIADYSVLGLVDFITGANKMDTHLLNTNINRDFKIDQTADIRMITDKDDCPGCGKPGLKILNGIELGHIFKLGTKYSKALNAQFLDEKGARAPMIMGCYGIGINRIIAAAIENSFDANGIIWADALAPYQVLIISINTSDKEIFQASQDIYEGLTSRGIEALWDDREVSPGIKFKDADLLGIPLIVTIGKGLKDKKVDLKYRASGVKESVDLSNAVKHIIGTMTKNQ